ncbi:MAG: hypothetical protein K6E30_06000 [Lachnospiraceae bacterium]|nr:hypothetical protein [Lachnospiraceae bacterium]
MILKLANKKIEIGNIYSYAEEYCRDYLLADTEEADFSFRITEADIGFEQKKSEREDRAEGRAVRRFSEEYLETLAIYRRIAEKMPYYDTFLFHGSVVAADGLGYLFTAKSGTGKSTHTRLWRELLGDRAFMVNDDKPLIRVGSDGKTSVFGTPWDGKHRLSRNIETPLKAICVLDRAEDNRICAVSKGDIRPMLLQQVYRPSDGEALRRTLELLDRMDLEFYHLFCNMDIRAAELSYGVMSRRKAEQP